MLINICWSISLKGIPLIVGKLHQYQRRAAVSHGVRWQDYFIVHNIVQETLSIYIRYIVIFHRRLSS